MEDQVPLPVLPAFLAVAGCAACSALLLAPRSHPPAACPRGEELHFADGTVYRATVVDRPPPAEPCVLVVGFRLRGVRGERVHDLFRVESVLKVPLFVGFPGLASKVWMANDSRGVYRGVYEWEGPTLAESYARALWRVLVLVSVLGSIGYRVLPGLRRDEMLRSPRAVLGDGRVLAAERDGSSGRVTDLGGLLRPAHRCDAAHPRQTRPIVHERATLMRALRLCRQPSQE